MKDHYTLLHNFLEKHFPAQLPKLEAIKDNDVEVIMMYNMYKKSAKNALKERVVSDNESPYLKAKIAADDFMQHYRKTYRTVNSNFGTEAGEEFKKIVKAKFNSMSEELKESTINEVKEMTFGAYLDDLDNRFVDLMKAAKGLNAEGSQEIDMRATLNQNFTLFRNYISALKKEYSDELNKELTFSINETKERMESSKVEYKVAGRPVTLNKGEKSDGTDWTVTFKNGKTTALADVLALIEPEPKLTMNEAKATCCHRCGRVHVKGTPCKRPYLKGKDSCAVREVQELQEKLNNLKETKSAPKGHYFTKSGNLVKGRMTKDAEERGARKSDPKDKMRSKIPKVTQYTEIVKEYIKKHPKMKKSEVMETIKDTIKTNN